MTSSAVSERCTAFAPGRFTAGIQTWDVVRAAHAQGECCGDAALVWPLDADRTGIALVDVAGHGESRAPLSSALAGAIVAALLRGESPAAALDSADQRLRRDGGDSPYAVAFAAQLNAASRTLIYASAGHDVAFALSPGGGMHRLAPTAPMLGAPFALHVCDAVIALEPADTLVIVTDGVSDSRPAGSNDFFGAERTALTVARARHASADPAYAVLEAACRHANGNQADDIAVVVASLNE